MLIVSLDVDRSRPRQLRARLQHRDVRTAGVEPDVEDVELFPELFAAAFAGGQKIGRRTLVPRVRSLRAKDLCDPSEELRRVNHLVAFVAVEDRDWNAPQSLARDGPVGTILDHPRDTLLAPCRVPLRFVNLFERATAKIRLVHRDEPLLRGAEDDRILAAPAVRILMRDRLAEDERAALAQML